MKYKILCALALFICMNVTAQKKWTSLFDGKTTNGWHTFGSEKVNAAWKVIDGSLTLDPNTKEGRGDIVTNESFNDFHLELEWKISKNGNSGIIFFVQDNKPKYDDVWATGAEMQVLDNEGHPDGKIIKHKSGNLYDLIAGPEGVTKPVGEWNKASIINEKGKLTLMLNGVVTATTTLGDDSWNALIQQSKFRDFDYFCKTFSGHISLQDHGDIVSYRNIRIRKL